MNLNDLSHFAIRLSASAILLAGAAILLILAVREGLTARRVTPGVRARTTTALVFLAVWGVLHFHGVGG